jgi:hypothetical protein
MTLSQGSLSAHVPSECAFWSLIGANPIIADCIDEPLKVPRNE